MAGVVGEAVGSVVAVAVGVGGGVEVKSTRLTWSGVSVGAGSRPRTTTTMNKVKNIVTVRAMSGRFMVFILILPKMVTVAKSATI